MGSRGRGKSLANGAFDCSSDIIIKPVRASQGCADPNDLQFTRCDLAGGFVPGPCRCQFSFVTCEHSAKDRDRDCPAVASVIKSWQNAAKSRRKSEEGRAAARTTAGFLSDSAFLILEPLLLKSISPSAGSFRFVLPHDRAALIDITPAARLERYPC